MGHRLDPVPPTISLPADGGQTVETVASFEPENGGGVFAGKEISRRTDHARCNERAWQPTSHRDTPRNQEVRRKVGGSIHQVGMSRGWAAKDPS